MRSQWSAGILAVTGLLVAFWVSGSGGDGAPAVSVAVPPMVGEAAPAVAGLDLDGERFELARQRGKVVVLDFWASWCPACVAALPHTAVLSQSEAAQRGELEVIAINLQEQPQAVRDYLAAAGLSLRTLVDDDGAIATRYGVSGIPAFFVVGRDGKVAWSQSGFDPEATPEGLEAAVEQSLARR